MKYNPKTIGIWLEALNVLICAGIGAFIVIATIKFVNMFW